MREVQVLASRLGARLFRNNVAMAWAGKMFKPKVRGFFLVGPDDVIIYNARPIHAGLCEGSSDLIGWQSVTVTEKMIGSVVALFAAVELKLPAGKVTLEQAAFIEAVKKAGGIGFVARSKTDVEKLISGAV